MCEMTGGEIVPDTVCVVEWGRLARPGPARPPGSFLCSLQAVWASLESKRSISSLHGRKETLLEVQNS